ncbi:MAG TPA: pyruvate kinase [Bryobacteraceae bacterium]|jgi:pyruvate kinase|nr:pyruvate kinase [Bryobacteraceae bacterium]
MRTTKIVATLGPATDPPEKLKKMFEAGVDVFRLNASHGTQDDHARRIAAIRQISGDTHRNVSILLDLQGPKIRLGVFQNGGCYLETGSVFTITTQEIEGTCEIAHTGYPEFARDVNPGDTVLLADGAVQLEVIASDGVSARCKVVHGGPISDRKGINLPGVKISTPSLSKKDVSDAHFGVTQGVDFIALSFVRTGKDVLRLRHLLDEADAKQPIIAKIEKPEAWQNLDSILEEADGIMVARGDLGVEMALEKVPMIQKAVIERTRQYGKFVITATQMLESMIENPRPTRAEVSDIANAIYDGTSALMLSAETSTGKYPIESVKMMAKIALETENAVRDQGFKEVQLVSQPTTPHIIADAAYHAARSAGASALVVGTTTGATARLLARYRPPVPIYAFTASEVVARQLSIVYGVQAIVAPGSTSTDTMLMEMERTLVESGKLVAGNSVVFVAGQPVNQTGTTNMLKLHRVTGRF